MVELPEGSDPAAFGAVDVTVRVIEPMGSESYVHADLGKTRIVIRAEPNVQATEREACTAFMQLDLIHLFDRLSGDALRKG